MILLYVSYLSCNFGATAAFCGETTPIFTHFWITLWHGIQYPPHPWHCAVSSRSRIGVAEKPKEEIVEEDEVLIFEAGPPPGSWEKTDDFAMGFLVWAFVYIPTCGNPTWQNSFVKRWRFWNPNCEHLFDCFTCSAPPFLMLVSHVRPAHFHIFSTLNVNSYFVDGDPSDVSWFFRSVHWREICRKRTPLYLGFL